MVTAAGKVSAAMMNAKERDTVTAASSVSGNKSDKNGIVLDWSSEV